MVPLPIAPEKEVVFVSGIEHKHKHHTRLCDVCGRDRRFQSMTTYEVTRKEPFQLTNESRRKSLPFTVNTN
jgi:hypothetical protein